MPETQNVVDLKDVLQKMVVEWEKEIRDLENDSVKTFPEASTDQWIAENLKKKVQALKDAIGSTKTG